MNKSQVLETLKLAKEHSKKRKFSQSIDLIINLNGLDLKNPEQNINSFVTLPFIPGKEGKVGAFVGDDLENKAKGVCDFIINKNEFNSYSSDLKKLKRLAKDADFLIAQGNLMNDIAKFFGKTLGPMGKMPNPKAGAVIPPNTIDLKPLVDRLKKTIKIQTKNEQGIKVLVGKESMDDDQVAENILAVHAAIVRLVSDESRNLRNALIKLTMGKPFVIGQKYNKEDIEKMVSDKKETKKPASKEDKPLSDKPSEEKPLKEKKSKKVVKKVEVKDGKN